MDAPEPIVWDALVQGSGLSGLTAALSLAAAGRSVLLSERSARLGGRCGTFDLDGHRFTIGCNDFGGRIVSDLKALGIELDFVPATNVIDLGDAAYRLPPDPFSAVRLLPRMPAMLRLFRRVRRGGTSTLGELYGEQERNDFGYRVAGFIAYALGTPPSMLRADHLVADFGKDFAYGHDRMVVPVGSPQAITDAMVARLVELGGTVWTRSDLAPPVDLGDRFVSDSGSGQVTARTVITTEPAGPTEGGLSVMQMLWATEPGVPWVNARTLIHSPPHPDRWIGDLHRGAWPDDFAFHVFRDVTTPESVTFTGYALAPRGHDTFDAIERVRLLDRAERVLEAHAPGFSRSVRFRRLLDPQAYRERHGVSPSLARSLPTPDAEPLPTEIAPGRYRIGNGTGPPGEHANAAMLSGIWAAERALAYLEA